MPGKPVYFAAADQESECYSGLDGLRRSLVLNLLFQPSPLFVPDVFCFLPRLSKHVIEHDTLSLIEGGLQAGVVRVASRFPDVSSFTELHRRLEANDAVGMHPKSNLVAHRLDHAAERSGSSPFFSWPKYSVADRFTQTLKEVLQARPSLSGVEDEESSRKLLSFWNATRSWRYRALDEAESMRAGNARPGIRRGDLLHIIAKDFIGQDLARVGSMTDLLPSVPPDQRGVLRDFWKVVVHCYQVNQARALGGQPALSNYDWMSDILLQNTLLPDSLNSNEGTSVHRLEVPIKIPQTRALTRLKVKDVIDLRSHYGAGYSAELRLWAANPSEANAAGLENSISEYSRKLTERLSSGSIVDVIALFWDSATKSTTRRLISGAIGLGGSVSGIASPWIPVVTAASVLGYTAYTVAKPPSDRSLARVASASAGEAEISIAEA